VVDYTRSLKGVVGVTQDFTNERVEWPFELENIDVSVLVFHGEEDMAVDPRVADYVCQRISSCDEPTIFPGEDHSVVYYQYKEIISAMLQAWK
jgi:pimeloyl-ACP methyl ester carboxylesterase